MYAEDVPLNETEESKKHKYAKEREGKNSHTEKRIQ